MCFCNGKKSKLTLKGVYSVRLLFVTFLSRRSCVVQAGVGSPPVHAAAGADPRERDEDERAHGQTSTISLLTPELQVLTKYIHTHTFFVVKKIMLDFYIHFSYN